MQEKHRFFICFFALTLGWMVLHGEITEDLKKEIIDGLIDMLFGE